MEEANGGSAGPDGPGKKRRRKFVRLAVVSLVVLFLAGMDWLRRQEDPRIPTIVTRSDLQFLQSSVRGLSIEYDGQVPEDAKTLLRVLQGESVGPYNPRKLVFWEARRFFPDPPPGKYGSFNEAGELIDRWGRPYVWERSGDGKLEVWSRLDDGQADKAAAMARGCYVVLTGP